MKFHSIKIGKIILLEILASDMYVCVCVVYKLTAACQTFLRVSVVSTLCIHIHATNKLTIFRDLFP